MILKKVSWQVLAGAAVVTVVAGGGFYWFKQSTGKMPVAQTTPTAVAATGWQNLKAISTVAKPADRTQWVTSLQISADGKILVSGGDDQTVKIWSLDKGESLRTLQGHSGAISSVAISPDGQMIASGSDDKTINLWNLQADKPLFTFKDYSNRIEFVAFSSDGKNLISVSNEKASNRDDKTVKTIKIWDVSNHKLLYSILAGEGTVSAIAFSPQKQILALASGEANKIDVWHLGMKKQLTTLTVQTPKVLAMALSADGQTLAETGDLGSIGVWRLEINQPANWQRSLGIKESIGTTEQISTLVGNTGTVRAIAFSPDGRTLFAGSRDLTVKIWNVESGDLLRILKGHSAWVEAVAISPDGKTLITASSLGEIKSWQPDSGATPIRKDVAENVRKLLGTRRCPECDLSGADMRNFSLGNVNLQWANISGANLEGANLNGANLEAAILFKANLKGANLKAANLQGANLAGANLAGANLEKANLDGANLKDANLEGAKMPDGKISKPQPNPTKTPVTTLPVR